MNKPHKIAERYELGDPIGSGAMGDVYKATDTQTGEIVAVKHLKSDLVRRDPNMLARFRQEGEALRQLNHPNIVTMIDTVEEDGEHYIIMKYAEGGSLRDLLNKEEMLPISRVLSIALDLADALTRAHRLDIIHRDIKPGNVLIEKDGTPRLTDFGIARVGDTSLTQEDGLMGTYAYLSPEACMGQPLDERADIWAFGVLLFEMLTGKRPFEADNPGTIITRIISDVTPDLQEFRTDTSDDLSDLLYRMLEKNRKGRIPSVRLVGAEVEAMLKGIDIVITRPTIVEAPTIEMEQSLFATPSPSTGKIKHNLPAQTTPFVGREAEMDNLDHLLTNPETRLVTLLGSGGMGKTRLAIEMGLKQAPTFEQGVLFVALDKYDDPENIPTAIADAADYKFQAGGSPREQILSYLANKHLLLIMDNYEHIIAGAGLVTEIMEAAPGVSVIATSREKLNIGGENIIVIGGMDFPHWETPADAIRYSAVQLFMQSATRTRINFELTADNLNYVARVCRLVQGVPLGILLAAAWVDTLTVEEITEEMQSSVDFLESERRDLPERHRSMRAAFDYSWRLLNDAEREGLARMSVFRGGCTRKAAQKVAGTSIRMLTALVNKSLLRREQESGRFEIHELIRQFAEEELSQYGEAESVRDAQAEYYLEAIAGRNAELRGPDQIKATDDVEIDFENVRAAWHWAVKQGHENLLSDALQALYIYCRMRTRFLAAVELFGLLREQFAQGSVLHAEGVIYHEIIIRQFEKRPDALRDISAALETLPKTDVHAGMGLYSLATAHLNIRAYEEAVKILKQSIALFESLGERDNQAWSLQRLGYVYSVLDDAESSQQTTTQALEIFKELGNLYGMVWANNNLATFLDNGGRRAEGLVYHQENYAIGHKLKNKQTLAWTGAELAFALAVLGRIDEGRPYLEKSLTLIEDINHTDTSGWTLTVSAYYSNHAGDYSKMRATFEQIKALPLTRSDMLNQIPLWSFLIDMEEGDIESARQYLPEFSSILNDPYEETLVLFCLASLLVDDGEPERAAELYHLALCQPISDMFAELPLIKGVEFRLRAALPTDIYTASEARGKTLDLDETIEWIKNEGLI